MTKPAQLRERMRKRAAAISYGMGQAHRDLYEGARDDHAQYTSGRVSTAQLRGMGHPFGRKAGGMRGVRNGATNRSLSAHARRKGNRIRQGKLQTLPINRQTGELRRSFFQSAEQGPDRTVEMGFRAAYATFVLSPKGTRRMIARGFYSSDTSPGVIARRQRARKAGIQAAVRRKILFFA